MTNSPPLLATTPRDRSIQCRLTRFYSVDAGTMASRLWARRALWLAAMMLPIANGTDGGVRWRPVLGVEAVLGVSRAA